MNEGSRPRLCYVVASPMTATAFLLGHIRMASTIYDVTVVANARAEDFPGPRDFPATRVSIPIQRRISLRYDILSLWKLYRLFRRERFTLVHSVSPKAGLLAMLAASLAGIRVRVHTFTGQVWANKRGLRRELLKGVDKVLGRLTTHALVDSQSQRDFLVEQGVLAAGKADVIGAGSICGVDGQRFKPDGEARRRVRRELDVPESAILLLFVGRINRDKGVLDLGRAFAALATRHADAFLLLVGPDEQGMLASIGAACGDARPRLRNVGFTPVPEHYMAAADILCLPSYREGFGMVVVEAASVGLPAVASRIYGITDAVVEGETGLLHPPGDSTGIEQALEKLVVAPVLRGALGAAARERALRDFAMQGSSRGLMAFYGKILG